MSDFKHSTRKIYAVNICDSNIKEFFENLIPESVVDDYILIVGDKKFDIESLEVVGVGVSGIRFYRLVG